MIVLFFCHHNRFLTPVSIFELEVNPKLGDSLFNSRFWIAETHRLPPPRFMTPASLSSQKYDAYSREDISYWETKYRRQLIETWKTLSKSLASGPNLAEQNLNKKLCWFSMRQHSVLHIFRYLKNHWELCISKEVLKRW